ncbi:MAG: DUF2279 domain-containing protein [Bacteroidota bacterium]
MNFRIIFLLLFLFATTSILVAQDTTAIIAPKKITFLEPYPTYNKKRFATALGGQLGLCTSALIGLNYAWYEGYPRSRFHFFNDAAEWQQIDKMGHMLGGYFQSKWSFNVYKWSGIKHNRAAWAGALTGWGFQTTIEILDGFSSKWGASASDALFNSIGSGWFLWQEMLWHEQRIQLKINYYQVSNPKGQLTQRANELYGTQFYERFLKDYNSMTFWLSANIASFNKKQKHATWLNVAVGYGAGGMYGGFDNTWTDPNGNLVNRNDVQRYRKFLISIDADFTKIPVRTRTERVILGLLNTIKLPAPALEFNTKGQIIFHPLYFLNWEMPLYFKK